jgi:predicted RNase H-like nuclease
MAALAAASNPLRPIGPKRRCRCDTRRIGIAVRYIGIDLAWGPNGTTGLAALDEQGILLEVKNARTDEEILDWARVWAPDDCFVSIDAPLIVRNASGQRTCERLVGRYFGKYNASCHASNLSLAHFAHGSRAMRIAQALDLTVDPANTWRRRVAEVYPHPAIVSLFNLPTVLRYKNKQRRSLDLLKAETLRLVDLLEGLERAAVPLHVRLQPQWQRIRDTVSDATRKSELAKVEDSIDGVVCAYIALVAVKAPASVRVIGNVDDGYILTPVLPEIAARIDRDIADGFSLAPIVHPARAPTEARRITS